MNILIFIFYSEYVASGSGFNVAGRIDSGHIQVGETVSILPVGETATVKSKQCLHSVWYICICLSVCVHEIWHYRHQAGMCSFC